MKLINWEVKMQNTVLICLLLLIKDVFANECIDIFFRNDSGGTGSFHSSPTDVDKLSRVWNGAFSVIGYAPYHKDKNLVNMLKKGDFEEAKSLCYSKVNESSSLKKIVRCYSYDLINTQKHLVTGSVFPFTSDTLVEVYDRLINNLEKVIPKRCNAYYVGVITNLDIYIILNYKKAFRDSKGVLWLDSD